MYIVYGKENTQKIYRRLSRKDKRKQTRKIKQSIRAYRRGVYIDRPKLKSYRPRRSQWVVKFEKQYGSDIKTYAQIEQVTGDPKKALQEDRKKR